MRLALERKVRSPRHRWAGFVSCSITIHALTVLPLVWLSRTPPTLTARAAQSTKVTLVGAIPRDSPSARSNDLESFRQKLAQPEPTASPADQVRPSTSLSDLLGETRSQPPSLQAGASGSATGGKGTAAAGAHDDPLARAAYSPPAARTGPNAPLAMQAARCWRAPSGVTFRVSLFLDGQGYPTSAPQIRPSSSSSLTPAALQDGIAALTDCSPYPVPHGSGPATYSFELG